MATEQWRKENIDSMRAYRRRWYANNRERAKNRVYERRKDLRAWMASLKESLRCDQCSENHPACLEFHHTDKKKKESSISMAIHLGWGRDHIQKEMKKCKILCSNCHRKLHYNEIRF